MYDKDKIQPAVPVTVRIELEDQLDGIVRAVHFGDEPELLEAKASQERIELETGSFSVFGVLVIDREENTAKVENVQRVE